MKIKKVDDKPMVIHTKEKTKIHSHEAKNTGVDIQLKLTSDLRGKLTVYFVHLSPSAR